MTREPAGLERVSYRGGISGVKSLVINGARRMMMKTGWLGSLSIHIHPETRPQHLTGPLIYNLGTVMEVICNLKCMQSHFQSMLIARS